MSRHLICSTLIVFSFFFPFGDDEIGYDSNEIGYFENEAIISALDDLGLSIDDPQFADMDEGELWEFIIRERQRREDKQDDSDNQKPRE